MAIYLDFDEVKKHCTIDFDDDDALIYDLMDVVEAFVLTDIQGKVTGIGTVQKALTLTTGTVQTAGITALVGTVTNFLSFTVGETITISGETVRTIATITDDTHLTVTSAFSTTASGLAYVVSTKKLLVGTETDFTNYTVGDKIKVQNETLRTIDSITDDTHLTVSVSFSAVATGQTYSMYPGIPSPIPEELRHAMKIMVKHFYDNRNAVLIGVNATEMPFSYKSLTYPFKNFTVG